MKKFTRYLVSILLALVLSGITPIVVCAATTSTITVTFTTQSLVAGATTPNSWTAGLIADNGSAATATGYFSTDNTSNCPTDWTIGVTGATWTGGTPYDHNDSGSPGAAAVAMKASPNTGAFDITVKNAATHNDLTTDIAANTDVLWEAKLWAPTSGSNLTEKNNSIVLTVRAH